MRIITLNCNGIRAAARKGLFDWLPEQDADVICLQEVRAPAEIVMDAAFQVPGYSSHHLCAERKGYSGVALFSRRAPDDIVEGLGWTDLDPEARYLEARYPGLSVVSVYIPSGSSKDERQQVKMRFSGPISELTLKGVATQTAGVRDLRRLEHRAQRDRPKELAREPEELRISARGTRLDGSTVRIGRIRRRIPGPEQGSRINTPGGRTGGQAWAKNVGWRLDYQVVSAEARRRASRDARDLHRRALFRPCSL